MAQINTARGTLLTYVIGVLALICTIAAAADFFFVAQNSKYDTEFFAQSTTAAVQSQALPENARRALAGDADAFGALAGGAQDMAQALALMSNGDPDTLMPAASGQVGANVALLQQHWSSARPAAQTIAGAKDSTLVAVQAAAAVRRDMPTYIESWGKLIQQMAAHNVSRDQISIAAQQQLAAQQSLQEMNSLMNGTGNLDREGRDFQNHVNNFGTVLEAFANGSPSLNIPALPKDSDLQATLGELQRQEKALGANLQTLGPLTADIVGWQQALATLVVHGRQMLSDAHAIDQTYADQVAARIFKPIYGYIFGGIALLLIATLVVRYQLTGDARRAARAQQLQNERNQEGIMRLLDELGTLADGDLTVELAVTEDITGAIADSINYTVEALRELVKTINDTALEVDTAARQTEATASQLAEASDNQSRQITSAGQSISQMARSIEQVSANAEEASEVARRSVDIAHKGGEAVRRTIEGMNSIREAIQDTSKRMKRLGESSQEIGDIVELINDIAEQTNILALNAAIQASTAGEAGRGFGVVADEVQRLAVRAASATRQIETLVRTIQSDTNEAIVSMEQSTAGVVSRAQLAENAGHALDEIESVSNDIAALIENISAAAREQAQVAGEVSGTMTVIQEITSQTSEGTAVTARSIGRLAALAAELRRSVQGFRLAEEGTAGEAPQDETALEDEETVHAQFASVVAGSR